MTLEKAVAAELRHLRESKGISQERLGFDAGIHRTYVSQIERGLKSPTLNVIFKVCETLEVSPVAFINGVMKKLSKE